MDFDIISSKRVRALLSPEDLRRAGISLESGGENDIKKLKRYLLLLLARIKSLSPSPLFERGSLEIEIYPDGLGGAEVYFEAQTGPTLLYEPSVFCFDNSDELIEAAVRLFALFGHRLFKSSLYAGGGLWYFIVRPIDGASSPALGLLSEYGLRVAGGAFAAALIAEHCKPVIRERAADMLAFYFGR